LHLAGNKADFGKEYADTYIYIYIERFMYMHIGGASAHVAHDSGLSIGELFKANFN